MRAAVKAVVAALALVASSWGAHVDILGIGDSRAEGAPGYIPEYDTGAGGPTGDTVSQIWHYLVPALADTHYTTYYNAGRSGDGAAGVASRIAGLLTTYTPHRVYLEVGVNDAKVSLSQVLMYTANLDLILSACVSAGAELVIDEIVPYSSSDAVKRSVRQFNGFLLQWAMANNVKVAVGSYAALEGPANSDCLNPTYTADGLHPNAAGYEAIAQCLAAARVPINADFRANWLTAMECINISPGNTNTTITATPRTNTFHVVNYSGLGNYDFTVDLSAGSVYLKSGSSAAIFRVDGNGNFSVVNGSATRKCWFTSYSDDAHGAVSFNSLGTPAVTDNSGGYVLKTGTGTGTISLDYCEAWYCTVTNSAVFGWGASSAVPMSFTNVHLANCAIGAGATGLTSFVGACGNYYCGTLTISNLNIDSTCVSNSSTQGNGLLIVARGNTSITNSNVSPTGGLLNGIWYYYDSGSWVDTIANTRIVACVDGVTTDKSALQMRNIGSGTITWNIASCVISNTGTGNGAVFTGKQVGSVTNTIFYGCDGVGAFALYRSGGSSVTHTHNGYYGNSNDCFEALGATEIAANPVFANLPAGCVINTALDPRPNGYAVTSASYVKHGSTTFLGAALDTASQSATGTYYHGADSLTPGISYWLSKFRSPVLDSCTAKGKAGDTLRLRGNYLQWAAHGTCTVGGASATWAAQTDTLAKFLVPSGNGVVDVIYTTPDGNKDTLSGAFTYTIATQTPRYNLLPYGKGRYRTGAYAKGAYRSH